MLAGLALAPSQASASRWPAKRITYRDESGMAKTVREAARLWNRSVIGPRLVPAPRGRRAMIRVVSRRQTTCGALGCGGYPPSGLVEITSQFVKLGSRRAVDNPLDQFRVGLVAHEIGHALGLTHSSNRCDVMAPAVTHCVDRIPLGSGATRCGPQRSDARALARLYGARVRRFDGLCRIVPSPRSQLIDRGPFVLTSPLLGTDRELRLRVRNRSGRTWGRDPGQLYVAFETLKSDNQTVGPTCFRSQFSVVERTVRPGATATVVVPACTTFAGKDIRLRPVAILVDASEAVPRYGVALPALRVSADDAPAVGVELSSSPLRTTTGWQVDFRAYIADDGGFPAASWSFGDGSPPVAVGETASHLYGAPGTYTVTVTATDSRGQRTASTASVLIEPDPPPPPPDPPPEESPPG